ncbi:MAG: hypothetical protein ACKOX3_06725 [Bacteroidota bacterium]
MIKIAFIIDKGFMHSLIEKCKKHLLSEFQCTIDILQWHHELRKEFPKAKEYDYVINFTTHTLFKKEYVNDNLIQIPFISNLRSGISRELYMSIVNNEDHFHLNTIKTFAGKQSFQIHEHKYLIIHHSYNRSYQFILNKIPVLLSESIKRFSNTNQKIWQDNHPKSIPLRRFQYEIWLNKLKHYFKSRFTYHYWKTGLINSSINEVFKNKQLLNQVTWFKQSKKKDFIADPFGFTNPNGSYIIYEKYHATTKKGHIEVMKINTQEVVFKLKANFHFSYPYVFEENNEIYVIPETHQTNSIDLYKWNDEKQNLAFVKTIIEDFPGVDNSILKYNNKYWLFCTSSKHKMADHQLFIFYADQLTGEWKQHVMNPVVTSIINARPAGSFILIDGKIIRPSQNSGSTYGGQIMFNEIMELNENKYQEKVIESISLTDFKDKSIKGIHTISTIGSSTLIDAKFTGFKIGKIYL